MKGVRGTSGEAFKEKPEPRQSVFRGKKDFRHVKVRLKVEPVRFQGVALGCQVRTEVIRQG